MKFDDSEIHRDFVEYAELMRKLRQPVPLDMLKAMRDVDCYMWRYGNLFRMLCLMLFTKELNQPIRSVWDDGGSDD